MDTKSDTLGPFRGASAGELVFTGASAGELQVTPFYIKGLNVDSVSDDSVVALGGYEVPGDQLTRSLWAVASSNERTNSLAGTILIATDVVPGPAPALANIAGRFRAFARLGSNTRRRSNPREGHYCYPNFHQADYGNGPVYGSVTVRNASFHTDYILASDMGGTTDERPSGVEARILNANKFAWSESYGCALPTFQQIDSSSSLRYGVVMFHESVVEKQFLVARTLPSNPSTLEEWFRAASDYAIANGYSAGFPTGKRRIGLEQDAQTREPLTYPMMLCAFFKPGVATAFDCNYSIASVLGSTFDFSRDIQLVNYLALEIPPLAGPDSGVPSRSVPVPT